MVVRNKNSSPNLQHSDESWEAKALFIRFFPCYAMGFLNTLVKEIIHMRKFIAPLLASLLLLGTLAACSPHRVKRKAPSKSGGLSMFDFRRAHCGCVGK